MVSLIRIGDFWINPEKVEFVSPQTRNSETYSIITFDSGANIVVRKRAKEVADMLDTEGIVQRLTQPLYE